MKEESSAKLMVAVCNQVVFIKINGKGDFNLSLDLKKLFEELRHRGYRQFALELCDCVMMDSTFLGLLSGFALKMGESQPPEPPLELMNPCPRLVESLESLGVIHLFKITNCPETPVVNYEPLSPVTDKTKIEVTRNCLEAHRTLIGLDPKNAQIFKAVEEFLTEDLKRLEMAEKK